jgi:[acyl-carrier-protein] S-malonyltransferase
LALVFPGQGVQRVGMGKALAERWPEARAVFERADAALKMALSRLCWDGSEAELRDTYNAQPAVLTTSVAYLEALRALRAEQGETLLPDMVAGHSLGEYSALVAAGTLSLEDAVRLVRERGRLMRDSGREHPGGMAAVTGLDSESLQRVCEAASSAGVVTVANSNAPNQTVISGDLAGLTRAIELARKEGAERVARLAVSIASHSPLMERASQRFSVVLAGFRLNDPQIPVVGNLAGQILRSAEDVKRELSQHLVKPVDWTRSVLNMGSQGPVSFIELGPGRVLTGLIKRISPGAEAHSASELGLEG